MAVAKKKKSKPKQESAGERLEEIQSRGEELSEWISENPLPILAAGGAVLLFAAIYGFATSGLASSKDEASMQIASVKNEYRQAMGGSYSGSLDIPEPANADAARETREEYIGRFQALADEYAGTEMGSYALIQVGSLQVELDETESALASFELALEPYDARQPMRGVLLEWMALLHEERNEPDAAIKRHIEASSVLDYPLRYFALLNAARIQAESGEADAAIANFDRILVESPDLLIPEHTNAMLLELKAQRSL